MKVKRYIIQEYNPKSLPPSFCDLDGTVRNTYGEALKLLDEFRQGNGYSAYGTSEFRVYEYMDEA